MDKNRLDKLVKTMASKIRNSQNENFKRIIQKGIFPAMSESSEEPQFVQAKAAWELT